MTDEDYYRTVGMFQMDMVGSKDAGPLIMYSADGEKNIVTDLGASAGARLSYTEKQLLTVGKGEVITFHLRK